MNQTPLIMAIELTKTVFLDKFVLIKINDGSKNLHKTIRDGTRYFEVTHIFDRIILCMHRLR